MRTSMDRQGAVFFLAWLTATWVPPLTVAGMVATTQGRSVVDVVCAKGGTAFVFAGVGVLVALLLSVVLARYWPMPWRQWVERHGWRLWMLSLLMLMPYVLAWLTRSSACRRGPAFFWESIFIETFILALLAVSYNLVFGFAGILSFGHAAFFGLGAYVTGLLMKHLGWNLFLSGAVALLTGAVLGLFMSLVALRTRGLYFALFSLAMAEVIHLLARNRILVHITGAEDGFVFSVPEWINPVRHRLLFYYLALVSLVVAFAFVYRLILSPTGRVFLALRDNETRAQMLGFGPLGYKTFALVISGLLASYAGILRALLNKGASPNVLSLDFTMDPLLMTILGGTATFDGPVVGAFLLRFVEHVLRNAQFRVGPWSINLGEHWALLLGLLFIAAVLLFPQGLMGSRQKGQETP